MTHDDYPTLTRFFKHLPPGHYEARRRFLPWPMFTEEVGVCPALSSFAATVREDTNVTEEGRGWWNAG